MGEGNEFFALRGQDHFTVALKGGTCVQIFASVMEDDCEELTFSRLELLDGERQQVEVAWFDKAEVAGVVYPHHERVPV